MNPAPGGLLGEAERHGRGFVEREGERGADWELLLGADVGELATPMYDAFTAKPLNGAPVNAIPANVNLLTRNTPAAPWVALSQGLNLARPDQVPQQQLDSILWKSVHGVSSTPPPRGPNASSGE
jgi:hypothetical protein